MLIIRYVIQSYLSYYKNISLFEKKIILISPSLRHFSGFEFQICAYGKKVKIGKGISLIKLKLRLIKIRSNFDASKILIAMLIKHRYCENLIIPERRIYT